MPAPPNGRYLEWSQVTLDINGVRYDNEISSASYSEKSSMKTLPGRGRRPKGRTRGKLEYEGKMKFSREAWADIVLQLGGSAWRDTSVNITVSFGEGDVAMADKLVDVLFHSPSADFENGEEALEIEVELSIMDIIWHGESENDRR